MEVKNKTKPLIPMKTFEFPEVFLFGVKSNIK
jgi:hypothetical protein